MATVHRAGLRHAPPDRADGVHATPVALLGNDAFYLVLRRRVAAHLRNVGCASGGPTSQCVALFWTTFVAWACCYAWLLASGTPLAANTNVRCLLVRP